MVLLHLPWHWDHLGLHGFVEFVEFLVMMSARSYMRCEHTLTAKHGAVALLASASLLCFTTTWP